MVTSLDQLDVNQRYTYSDYLLWQFKERVELFKGRLFPMAAPSIIHQKISSSLHIQLGIYFSERNCDVFSAPIDVRLPLPSRKVTLDKIDTVVQPDLCVVCDELKLHQQSCVGAPELVVEILSPSNSRKEMGEKYSLYEEAGVLEYWVIDPEHHLAFVYELEEASAKFITRHLPALTDVDVLESRLFPGLRIELKNLFPQKK